VRARLLLALIALAVVIVAMIAVGVALGTGSSEQATTVISADVSTLRNGQVLPVAVRLPSTALPPHRDQRAARIFFVHHDGQIAAYLGVSPHLGCSLLIPGDQKYGRGFSEVRGDPKIEDPCGGSTYAFDGRCVGGPCPRDLDRYKVRLSDKTARIDVRRLIAGPARTYR